MSSVNRHDQPRLKGQPQDSRIRRYAQPASRQLPFRPAAYTGVYASSGSGTSVAAALDCSADGTFPPAPPPLRGR